MSNNKLKNLLAENMRRFNTKNLNEQGSADGRFVSAKKVRYENLWDDVASAAEELAEELETPKMEDLPIVVHALSQLKNWCDAKKPAPLAIYTLVDEAPALLDAMQAKSKNAWAEMRSHWGAIVDAIADEDEDEYVTECEPNSDDMI